MGAVEAPRAAILLQTLQPLLVFLLLLLLKQARTYDRC